MANKFYVVLKGSVYLDAAQSKDTDQTIEIQCLNEVIVFVIIKLFYDSAYEGNSFEYICLFFI